MKGELIKKLEVIKKAEQQFKGLRYEVVKYALDYHNTDDEIKSFFSDLLNHGCVSGMINSLIYYSDTNKFYKKHENEIEELINNISDDFGYKTRAEAVNSLNGIKETIEQERNLLAWFGFEETARKISEEIELEE